MPFGKEGTEEHKKNKDIFDNIITPAVKAANPDIVCLRSDMINKSGSIIKDIISHLHKDEIVIADLSGKNANVFYELGVRQALSKRSILISQNIKDVPFDLRPYRVATYKYPAQDENEFNKKIKEYIEDILNNPEHSDSPVSDYLPTLSSVLNSEEKLRTSFEVKLMPGYTGELHVYRLALKVENISEKTMDGINMELEFCQELHVEPENNFIKGPVTKIYRIIYDTFLSEHNFTLQPGKYWERSVSFKVDGHVYTSGILGDKFYWKIFANDMKPIRVEDVLSKHTRF